MSVAASPRAGQGHGAAPGTVLAAGAVGGRGHPFSTVGTKISAGSSALPCIPQLPGWDLLQQKETVLLCLSFPSCGLQVITEPCTGDVVNSVWQKAVPAAVFWEDAGSCISAANVQGNLEWEQKILLQLSRPSLLALHLFPGEEQKPLRSFLFFKLFQGFFLSSCGIKNKKIHKKTPNQNKENGKFWNFPAWKNPISGLVSFAGVQRAV